MELLGIALRNVFRNPRRSLLNILAIMIGVMVILNLQGWIRGFTQTVFQTQMDIDTGHVQILDQGYEDEKTRLPLDLRVKDWPAVKKSLQGLPDLQGISARIDFSAQITNGVSGIQVNARGVDPDGEALVTNLKSNLVQGTWFTDNNSILIGSGLAGKLNLKVGQQVFLTALDQYGVRNLVDGTVAGIFSFGYSLFDDNVIFTTLNKAQDTLALEKTAATRVVVRFKSSLDTAGDTRLVAQAISAALPQAGLKVYEWKEFAQTVVSSIESRVRVMTFMLLILMGLVVVGILNSMSMSVQERFREIGTLRAIGMNRRKLTRLFLLEGLGLGLLGGLVGILVGGTFAFFFSLNGLDVKSILPKDLPIPFTSVMKPVYFPTDYLEMLLLAAVVSVIGSWQPARRAGRMSVTNALGSHL